jgi:hypothetical protein
MNKKNNRNVRPKRKSNKVVQTEVIVQTQSRRPPRRTAPQRRVDAGYLATLVDPWGVRGKRIPDEITHVTGTSQLHARGIIAPIQGSGSDTSYIAGLCFTPSLLNCIQTTSGTGASYANGTLTWATAQDSFVDAAAIQGIARQFRVVSAGLAVWSSAPQSGNQGRNICNFYPGNDRQSPIVGASTTPNTLIKDEINSTTALNQMNVCAIKYHPTDRDNYRYHQCDANHLTANVGTASYFNPGQLVWVGSNVASGISWEYHIVMNIEYLQRTSTISLGDLRSSLYDIDAMMLALNNPLVAKVFGAISPASITESQTSNSWADDLTATMGGSLYRGVKNTAAHASEAIGRALVFAGLKAVADRVGAIYNGPPPLTAGLLGRPVIHDI